MSNYLHLGSIWPTFGHCIGENGIHTKMTDNAEADYRLANP